MGWQEWGGEWGGHDQSRRLEEGVIMKYINKCRRPPGAHYGLLTPPNLLYTVNDSSNQNTAYIKNHILIQKTVTILRKKNVPTMRSDRVCRGNCITGPSWSPSPSFSHSLSEDWVGGRGGKLKEEGERGKLNKKSTQSYVPHKHL